METEYQSSYNVPQPQHLQIDEEAKITLYNTAKWAKFLAIVGFVGVGLLILLAFFIGPILEEASKLDPARSNPLSSIGSGLVTIIYLCIAAVYFFPCLFLFRFATRMINALKATDQPALNSSLIQLKTCFKFIGGIIIVILSLYGLIIIGAIVAGLFFNK